MRYQLPTVIAFNTALTGDVRLLNGVASAFNCVSVDRLRANDANFNDSTKHGSRLMST